MINRIVQAAVAGGIILGAHSVSAQTSCTLLNNAQKGRLIEYVQKKYKTPPSVHLEVAELAFIDGSCFRRLQFTASEARSNFRLDLFASSDLRFLTRELMDSTADPVAEERQKAEALSAGLSGGDFPARGTTNAPVTLTVFSDFECPFCSRFAAIVKDLSPEETARVRLVFRHLPLSMHPWARPAAEAAACAGEQSSSYFWAFHDFMFDHQKELNRDNLLQQLAESAKPLAGFDQGRFAACVINRQTAAKVDRDISFAQENGISATPTAFLNGKRTQIVAPEQLHTIIRELSNAAASSQPPTPTGVKPAQ